jgi:Ca-activated chloride channel family protein
VHIATHLDLDVIAVEHEDELSLLVELTAPTAAAGRPHLARTLIVVLDRSGSMQGGRLAGAERALTELVDRLDPQDRFGLVTFDNTVRVEIPAAPLSDKAQAKQRIAAIRSGGATDLSAGYLRGLQEARRCVDGSGGTLLLISDGHANAGVVDPEQLAAVAAKAAADGISTSTVGFGLGYDERLLKAIAAGGNGSELFAEHADQAVTAISGELDGLLSQTAQAASLLVRMTPACRRLRVINELTSVPTADGVQIELGAFYSGELRRLVITFDVPGIAALGLAQIADLDFTWVELPGLVQHSVTVPVDVNVVPGDRAAGRIPDPTVRTELAFLRTQQAKRVAAERMSLGDSGGAIAEMRAAGSMLRSAMAAAPAAMMADLSEDLDAIDRLTAEAAGGDLSRAAKALSADTSRKSRRRGSGSRV